MGQGKEFNTFVVIMIKMWISFGFITTTKGWVLINQQKFVLFFEYVLKYSYLSINKLKLLS